MNRKIISALSVCWITLQASQVRALSNWTGAVDGDYSNASNWDNGVPTFDVGVFNNSSRTSISLQGATSNGWTFGAAAPAYTITHSNVSFVVLVQGPVTNQSVFTQTLINAVNNTMNFSVGAFTGPLDIQNNSTGGMDMIGNNAGTATITNNAGGQLRFTSGFDANHAVIILNGNGNIVFNGVASGGTAQLRNNGTGVFDFTTLGTTGTTAGSIAGTGNFNLGSKSLAVGGNDLSTTVSGLITGTGGALVKTGAGTLTLSGANTYTGGTTMSGGILSVTSDNNLGDPAGGLAFSNNGVLQTGAGLSSARGSIMGTGGGTIDTNGFNSTFSGNVTGAGSLTKSGVGTLTLSGTNSYGGGTTVSAGALQGNTTSLQGNILNNASVVFNQTVGGTYAGSMSGNGSMTTIGPGTLTLTGTNTYAGGTIINAGILRTAVSNTLPGAGSVTLANTAGATLDLNGFSQTIGSLSGGGSTGGNVTLGSAILTVGSDNTSTVYVGAIIGSGGSLNKVGTGNLTLTGVSTNIDTTVNAGTLSGTGTLGRLTNNGTVVPGTSGVGTLHVASYSGPGTLVILFNGASHADLNVVGNAALAGGTLDLSGSNFLNGQYTVLTAGSVTGTFSTIGTPTSYFHKVDTIYSPTDVEILVAVLPFQTGAQSNNQLSVGAALDATQAAATGQYATAVQSISALPSVAEVQHAYDQISGDALASFQNISFRNASFFTDQMRDRAAAKDPGTGVSGGRPVQVADAGPTRNLGASEPHESPNALWAHGLGFRNNVRGNSSLGSPGADAKTTGFQVGYDLIDADDFRLGFSGGYATTELSVDDRSSSGNNASVQSGFYAGYTPGSWFLDGSLAYMASKSDLTRLIDFPGIHEQAKSNFHSGTYMTFVEIGNRLKPRENLFFEPSISLRYSHLEQNSFAESGAPGLDLTVEDQTADSLVSAVGARLTHRFRAKSSHPFTLGASAAWQHELGKINNSITAQFAEAPAGGAFTVQGTPRSRNAAALGLQGRLPLTPTLQAFADYSATIGSGQNTQGLLGGLSLKW